MPAVKLEHVSKSYGSIKAVEDVTLEVETGTFLTLLGPSGCGKTTTLRMIAGLERPDRGEIFIGDQLVSSASKGVFLPPDKRRIGMVFQSYAIWPHMTVKGNVAFPLEEMRFPRAKIKSMVKNALELVQLGGLESRNATQLSGGQQQRVALARALVYEPQLLLLDEPLSNLDARLREHMRFELSDLQKKLKTTTVYVTHDQIEAFSMSEKVAVMIGGRLLQIGSPREIYHKPSSRVIADFVGMMNVMEATVAGENKVNTPFGEIMCLVNNRFHRNEKVYFAIRPESIEIYHNHPRNASNIFEGIIESEVFGGEVSDFRVTISKFPLRIRMLSHEPLSKGDKVYLEIRSNECLVMSL